MASVAARPMLVPRLEPVKRRHPRGRLSARPLIARGSPDGGWSQSTNRANALKKSIDAKARNYPCEIRVPLDDESYVTFKYQPGSSTQYTVAISAIGAILQRSMPRQTGAGPTPVVRAADSLAESKERLRLPA